MGENALLIVHVFIRNNYERIYLRFSSFLLLKYIKTPAFATKTHLAAFKMRLVNTCGAWENVYFSMRTIPFHILISDLVIQPKTKIERKENKRLTLSSSSSRIARFRFTQNKKEELSFK